MEKQKQKTAKEKFQFQAEMSQLLKLIAHSLYSHREVFLRELISNSSDALNKLRFASLTDSEVLGEDADLKIGINIDEEKKTFSISDNGVGMSRDELISNIGIIAGSGTSEFFKKLSGDAKKDMELIGQFGVGFYSVFMVADEVTVETRSYKNGQGFRWVSAGGDSYSVESIERESRGTTISFKFKEDAEEFATKNRIESIIKKYSDFVSFPINLNDEKTNKSTALWARPKQEIKEEEYNEFFKYLTNSHTDPLSMLHLNVEAPLQFKSILFIPDSAERSLFTAENLDSRIQLYAQRVFIQDDCKEILPQWLRFVKGLVDSEDIDLNVSREFSQKNLTLEKINKHLVKKLIEEFQKWADKDKEKYEKFWKSFGNFIKEGIHSDFQNKDKLVELYRAYSSYDQEKLTSLQEYIDRTPVDQKEIYYASGPDRQSIENSPNIEYFKTNNLEVLYFYEEADEFIMPAIGQYKDKTLVAVDQADINIGDKEKEKEKSDEDDKDQPDTSNDSNKKLLGYFKDLLKEQVEDVVESKRLVDSPCTLVYPKDGMSPHMERMMKMMDSKFKGGKKVMELNLSNPLIKRLSQIREKFPQDPLLKDCIEQLYECAALNDGSLENTSQLGTRSVNLMERATELYIKSLES